MLAVKLIFKITMAPLSRQGVEYTIKMQTFQDEWSFVRESCCAWMTEWSLKTRGIIHSPRVSQSPPITGPGPSLSRPASIIALFPHHIIITSHHIWCQPWLDINNGESAYSWGKLVFKCFLQKNKENLILKMSCSIYFLDIMNSVVQYIPSY